MRILLVQPSYQGQFGGLNQVMVPEPFALELLAAMVPEHDVRIIDLRIEENLDQTLEEFRPQLVGVTSLTANSPQALLVCKRTKRFDPNIFVVAGGYHAALSPQDFDGPHVDAVVIGEGEGAFAELVAAIDSGGDLRRIAGLRLRHEGKVITTVQRPLIKDLDTLPFPARNLTERFRQQYAFYLWPVVYAVETARGCPYRCNFCAVWQFHHGYCRLKTPERVLDELRRVPGKYVFFVDDNFLQNLTRAQKIGRLVAGEGINKRYWMQVRSDSVVRQPKVIEQWAKLGLSITSLGFETFREEDLKKFDKHNTVENNEKAVQILKENGVQVWGSFIVDPAWDRRDFDCLVEYVERLRLSFHQFTVLTPIPGTGFFAEKLQELLTTNYERFDFLHSVLPTKLPAAEFYENMARLYAMTKLSMADLRRGWHEGDITPETLRRLRDMLQRLANPQTYMVGEVGVSAQ